MPSISMPLASFSLPLASISMPPAFTLPASWLLSLCVNPDCVSSESACLSYLSSPCLLPPA
jgi:hypothetical protein